MPLKRLEVSVPAASAKKKDARPVLQVPGNLVHEFNAATAAAKETEKVANIARGELASYGAEVYFKHNAKADVPVTSVDLVDETGATARFTSQDKYSAADPEAVDAVFTELGADINKYMQEVVVPKFNAKVFLTGADGIFDQEIFAVYEQAIAAATRQLILNGKLGANTPSPLTAEKKVLPLATFNDRRYRDFTAKQNEIISAVVKNTVTITPVS